MIAAIAPVKGAPPGCQRGRRAKAVGIVSAIIVGVAAMVGVGGSADATQSAGDGRPGPTRVFKPMITAFEEQNLIELNVIATYRVFGTMGLQSVKRSPATASRQRVAIRYLLQQWDGTRWVTDRLSPVYRGWLTAAQPSLSSPAWATYPSRQPTLPRSYRFAFVVRWYTPGGKHLGSRIIVPAHSGETACSVVHMKCTAAPGFVTL
ncbi:hypothetical protein [Demequina silvatica]|uniref:hypothetical protein n=1 Tax=Demequina silvatica TaxID=1638988 RepID=UPI0012E02C8C|nr:hypothetical protein [Demequina silvatica]